MVKPAKPKYYYTCHALGFVFVLACIPIILFIFRKYEINSIWNFTITIFLVMLNMLISNSIFRSYKKSLLEYKSESYLIEKGKKDIAEKERVSKSKVNENIKRHIQQTRVREASKKWWEIFV